jgi:hypothetical protein
MLLVPLTQTSYSLVITHFIILKIYIVRFIVPTIYQFENE